MELHDYQKRAIDFAVQRKHTYMMADMGLGKTAIALHAMRRIGITTIVVAPEQACYTTWPDEMRLWTPELTTTILHGPDKNIRLKLKRSFYVMPWTSIKWFYNACVQGKFPLRKFMWVLDEGSMLKSHQTKRFKMFLDMAKIMSVYRMILSASPAPNGLHNLWPQYRVLDGGKRLGKGYYKFRDRFFNYDPLSYRTDIKPGCSKQIYKLIDDITFRLDEKDHLKLDPYVYNPIYIDLPPRLEKMHRQFDRDFGIEFAANEMVTAATTAVARQKLRQFMQGAMYLDTDKPLARDRPYKKIHNLKYAALKEILQARAEKPLAGVIQFRFEHELMEWAAGKVPSITGKDKDPRARARIIRLWNDKKIPFFYVHPQSLSHAVNLQFGGHEIAWMAPIWSLELFDQFNGRFRRQGQTKPVIVNVFIIRGSVDEDMFGVLRRKKRTQDDLLNALRGRYL